MTSITTMTTSPAVPVASAPRTTGGTKRRRKGQNRWTREQSIKLRFSLAIERLRNPAGNDTPWLNYRQILEKTFGIKKTGPQIRVRVMRTMSEDIERTPFDPIEIEVINRFKSLTVDKIAEKVSEAGRAAGLYGPTRYRTRAQVRKYLNHGDSSNTGLQPRPAAACDVTFEIIDRLGLDLAKHNKTEFEKQLLRDVAEQLAKASQVDDDLIERIQVFVRKAQSPDRGSHLTTATAPVVLPGRTTGKTKPHGKMRHSKGASRWTRWQSIALRLSLAIDRLQNPDAAKTSWSNCHRILKDIFKVERRGAQIQIRVTRTMSEDIVQTPFDPIETKVIKYFEERSTRYTCGEIAKEVSATGRAAGLYGPTRYRTLTQVQSYLTNGGSSNTGLHPKRDTAFDVTFEIINRLGLDLAKHNKSEFEKRLLRNVVEQLAEASQVNEDLIERIKEFVRQSRLLEGDTPRDTNSSDQENKATPSPNRKRRRSADSAQSNKRARRSSVLNDDLAAIVLAGLYKAATKELEDKATANALQGSRSRR